MPRKKLIGQDARGKKVRLRDRVIDKKGNIYEVTWTSKGLSKAGLIRAKLLDIIPDYVLLKSGRVFRVSITTKKGSRRRWTRLYDKYIKPAKRKARRLRKKVEAMPLRPCPVCIKDSEHINFKLGTSVWKGKKLRVCTKRCARIIRREVKIVVQYGVDRDVARRKAAYKYMKIGGQI